MTKESSASFSGNYKRRKKSTFRQLLLLAWKNLLLRKRHWLLTAFEIILPVLLFTILLSVRVLPDSVFVPDIINTTTKFKATTEKDLRNETCNNYGNWIEVPVGTPIVGPILDGGICIVSDRIFPGDQRIFYGPPGNFTRRVAEHVALHLGLMEIPSLGLNDNVMYEVDSLLDMDDAVQASYFQTNDSWNAYYVGLFFNDTDGETVPTDLKYELRMNKIWFTEQLYPFLQIPGPRNYPTLFDAISGFYNLDGFTLVQSLVDRFFIAEVTGDESYKVDYKIETEMYPYPPYVQDNGMSQLYGSALPTFIVLSLVLLSPSLIKSVVHEKETGVRELVKLMGMDGWLGWLGWFFHSFIIIIVVSSLITVMLKLELTSQDEGGGKLPAILAYSDGVLVWLLLLMYGISSIAFCFSVATFFSKPTLATTMGILLWLTSYFIPRTIMDYEYNTMTLTPKILSCLLPNMAITWAFRIIAMFEGRTLGVQWNNLWETGNPRDQLTMGMILLMMALDTFIFLLITWYVDQVSPGVYGVPEPWYFPFQKTYWFRPKPKPYDNYNSTKGRDDEIEEEYFEKEPVGLRPGIVIKNLRKEFSTLGGKKKVAVENVSLTCYEGQCTVLLGHNGAGKTTTMSVLTGVYAPSSGYAEVGGWDIANNLREAREEVGLCPQHNMLFVDLTVFEHLLFFGRLKGMTSKDARKEAKALMSRLELLEKKNMYGSQLSGGMKRKLCLAISLIGGSKVVILDEPSSGLDPESRRWVWDVVQRERGRRTVLVTTHHMEEADVLGDRVAIMASGKVVASGSTLFLKNKFGDGYTLTIMVSKDSSVAKLSEIVTGYLPSAVLRTAQGGEVTFKLPPTTADFAPLLDALGGRKLELGIGHLGLSLTSMEQVFLRVGSVLEGEDEGSDNRKYSQPRLSLDRLTNGQSIINLGENEAYSSQRFLHNSQTNVEMRLKGWSLMKQRIKAFFVKRIIYTQRKWVLLLTQALLPVVVTIMCLAVDASFNEDTFQEPPILLNTSIYAGSSYYVHADPEYQDLADKYQELFWGPYKVNYTDDMDASLLAEAERDLFYYRENNICSAEFLRGNDSKTTMRMLYQSVPYHTPGVGVSLITNALLRYATNSSGASITTNNRPLPPNRSWKVGTDTTSASALVYSMTMPLALAFLSASFLVFPLQERESKAKQVQVMTGAPLWILWFTSFVWDLLAYMVSALIVFLTIIIGDAKTYFTVAGAPGALFLLLFMYGWGSIPMAYVFSFPFESAASGFAMLAVVNILAGQIITTAVWALDLSGAPKLELVSDILSWITSVIPTYPASMGFMHLVDISDYNTQCDILADEIKDQLCDTLASLDFDSNFLICCPQCATVGNKTCFQERSYFQFDEYGMGPDILTLFLNGIVFFLILIVIEVDNGRFFKRIWWYIKGLCSRGSVTSSDIHTTDEDVLAEASLVETMIKNRIENPGMKDDATLLVSGLTKQFFGSAKPAVNNVSFRVGRGECLGLLGVNGAGKTTTFRMLTGDEKPSNGDAYIDDDVSLKDATRKFVREIGYCPQFDAILGELTGEEMLTLLGRLRGVSDSRMKHVVGSLVTLVGLTECAKRPSSTYSGGNKRKLSTAMALVGSPPLVFLDEPTSGVDPASRRRVWTAVSQAVNNGQSVVLTSHSMEECEALCSRIIIMSRGHLRCVGSTGHLKTKFGQGYSLQIKLKTYSQSQGKENDEETYNARVTELQNIINLRLPGSKLTDQHKGMLAYRIPSSISWGHLFSVMEALKTGQETESPRRDSTNVPSAVFSSSLVEDYAASDTSLEQVFLSFAREAAETLPKNIPTEVVTKL